MGTRTSLLTLTAVLLVTVTASTPASAVRRYSSHYRHHKGHYRHIVWNPVLKGSYDSMLRQNEEIDRLQLPRIVDDAQLEELVRTQELVAISESQSLHVSPAVKPDKRYCRPWTNQFLEDMGEAYYKEFSVPLQVNSAVRTMEQQHKLRRHNRNAAPEDGDISSSHLAGITVDLAKRGLTRAQHKWVEDYLKNLRDLGLVEVAEERRQACFHVMVSDRYTEWKETNTLADKLVRE
ncbi:MAG: hypothetical protein DMG65_20435 [Candidatus Angelobacter sp. Gp1-AA117]|nr:MAG: hypothetical protein DMG65_20435 [Candidatus Angelobacter sp. Gp1-AA117]